MVLVNFGVLTTGFDAPKASAIVIAHPLLTTCGPTDPADGSGPVGGVEAP